MNVTRTKRGFRVSSIAGFLVLSAILAGPALAESAAGSPARNAWTLCSRATSLIERQAGIPRQLLRAISKVESGRWHRGKRIAMAWPWTVMAEGRGRYLPTKAAAIAEVEGLLARGVRNIDVGCMQINLHYHPDAFDSLEEAFDPIANVTYAAEFLTNLAAEHGSWVRAVAHYHSANPSRYRSYRAKVHKTWLVERASYAAAIQAVRNEPQSVATAELNSPAGGAAAAPVPPVTAELPKVGPTVPLWARLRTATTAPGEDPLIGRVSLLPISDTPPWPTGFSFSRAGPAS